MKRFNLVRNAGRVKRFHTTSVIGEQTVADHTYGVMCIIQELWPDCSKKLLLAAMYHDSAEYLTGDNPAPAKRKYATLHQALSDAEEDIAREYNTTVVMDEKDERRLKIADITELVLFAREQLKMGNGYFTIVLDRGLDYLSAMGADEPDVAAAIKLIRAAGKTMDEQKGSSAVAA